MENWRLLTTLISGFIRSGGRDIPGWKKKKTLTPFLCTVGGLPRNCLNYILPELLSRIGDSYLGVIFVFLCPIERWSPVVCEISFVGVSFTNLHTDRYREHKKKNHGNLENIGVPSQRERVPYHNLSLYLSLFFSETLTFPPFIFSNQCVHSPKPLNSSIKTSDTWNFRHTLWIYTYSLFI